ncbi:MAG: exonuclease SbcCD subunit D C-terminal domain-containing protein [Wenzhouxiangellaceae bacterium]|nr:exonuclease SbcCD subunit D C-terminal domain-containing protein [Wenzhouxiangellaceae bacterium]
MKLIHTSDWHLGQLFHGHERSTEHQVFLDWLIAQLHERQPDALLIAGDIFDHANPSGQSQRQFYRFLAAARECCPKLDIVVIAGNHDSAGRLEAPESLLETFGIRVVGQLQPDEKPGRALIPLHNASDEIAAWCLGIPYLRPGDVPRLEGERQNYVHGIAESYRLHLETALQRREPHQALIAMGHLHAQDGTTSEDSERRLVIGGEEAIDAGVFSKELAYVALGHLHLAQTVGGQERIRYCGSPLPLSFTETNYPHQILEVQLDGNRLARVESIPVPRPVPMLRIPRKPAPLQDVLRELEPLAIDDVEPGHEPWLEVQVLLEGPEPGLRQKIEEALAEKRVRLVKISPTRQTVVANGEPEETEADLELKLEKPDRMFIRRYHEEWGQEPGIELLALFREVEDAARQGEAA